MRNPLDTSRDSGDALRDDVGFTEQDAGDVPLGRTVEKELRKAEETVNREEAQNTSATTNAMAELEVEAAPAEERPYSVFTPREKWIIVMLISLGALFRCALG
jgi:hypothetical protein